MKPQDKPETREVKAIDGSSLNVRVPRYLVYSVAFSDLGDDYSVKLIDIEDALSSERQLEAFEVSEYQPPKLVFKSQLRLSADIWSFGCIVGTPLIDSLIFLLTLVTMFEFVTASPPFENLTDNREDLIEEWISMIGRLPE